jgi:spermidine/putrescine transport system ATP-binding protein
MNEGQVEQIGAPREIYEHPSSAFVADFIGSLNALEVTVDEIVGGLAVARLGEGERIVVPVAAGARRGAPLRVAVRPEHVRISAAAETGSGSRVEGTIAEIVYLGMYTQFHVDTASGRVLSHRIADQSLERLAVGEPVTLTWEPEDTYVLDEARPGFTTA